ncbi:tRNA uridine-5-carboxymethylaminomethyl(34) synthesis GTPase MnmE [Buchnera aphidicola]|uniref:tRNA uridine-5-carboxymethylaminomethyl(34) synthesis GTPase MnmE n=1 Tax=Buchnera aphidicola TaxID=9 RepID=UPI0031B898AE
MKNDTIIGQATPYGRSGVGILRISGNQVKDIAYKILGKLPPERLACYFSFYDYKGCVIDQGLVLRFVEPRSFTGEDVLELQGHGNPIILDLLIKTILLINKNIRIANPGEFSERAFLNNKIDLIQAESIIKLINAENECSIKSSLQSLKGVFSREIKNLINKVTDLRIMIEMVLNFPDEPYDMVIFDVSMKLNEISQDVKRVYQISTVSKKLYAGSKVVLSGPTNVGKSSIFNSLINKNSAIVTNIHGTTRDLLHQSISLYGITLQITDTAGFRSTKNIIEKIGIKKTWDYIDTADHIFFVIEDNKSIYEKKFLISNFLKKVGKKKSVTILLNKSDILKNKPVIKKYSNGRTYIILSAKTGSGICILKNYLKSIIKKTDYFGSAPIFLARRRHLNILNHIIHDIAVIKKKWLTSNNIECLAEDLKNIQNMLNEITGVVTSQTILNSIFKRFCIGK